MVFTSPIFLFYFLPLVLAGYYALPRSQRNTFLALSSYVFYGWWNPWYVFLMLGSTVVDWFCGIAITREGATEGQRRAGVATSVAVNLGLLGFFKYSMFFQENWLRLSESLGGPSFSPLVVLLPVGISFYTFQSMSYSIDLYRGHATRADHFRDFLCYVAMFPQLVMGPIVRYRELADQLRDRPHRGELFHLGVLNFMIGFAKKVLIANTMGETVDVVFESGALPAHVAWFGTFAFGMQIYFDFSGYSDMAIGLGQMLGFSLPLNFRSPYHSRSYTEFWQRWHLSLSQWLRDYLYIPLGGNRHGAWKTYRNLFLVMVLGGFWHGAQWNMVVFGLCMGILLAGERMLRDRISWRPPRLVGLLYFTIVFQLLWGVFRTEDMADAGRFLSAMFAGTGDLAARAVTTARVYTPFQLGAMGVACALVYAGVRTEYLVPRIARSLPLAVGLFALFAVSVVWMFAQSEAPFIYFQF